MTRILKQITTDYDNVTFDTGRTIAVIYFLSAIIFQGFSLYHGGAFDAQSYLVGGGGFLAGLGAYLFGDNHKKES
jgi:hypothetical protein